MRIFILGLEFFFFYRNETICYKICNFIEKVELNFKSVHIAHQRWLKGKHILFVVKFIFIEKIVTAV